MQAGQQHVDELDADEGRDDPADPVDEEVPAQQQGRSDQASGQQNENTRDSNGGNRGQLQQGLSDRERAAARARAALYI